MNNIAYLCSMFCAALLGSITTYVWLTRQATDQQKRNYPRDLAVGTLGFAAYVLILWLVPPHMRIWITGASLAVLFTASMAMRGREKTGESQRDRNAP
jgi:hypothetical protein